MCEELARRGQNVVLVSRTVSKLQQCAQELETKYKVKTKIIDIDFSSEANIQQRIEADTQVGGYMMMSSVKHYVWRKVVAFEGGNHAEQVQTLARSLASGGLWPACIAGEA